jgi:DNA-binding response OmpR family regulator
METNSAEAVRGAVPVPLARLPRTGFAPQALPGGQAHHVVVAEDDPDLRATLAAALRERGCDVSECRTGIELVDLLTSCLIGARRRAVDLVIADVRLPGISGLDVLGAVRRLATPPPTILITSFGDARARAQARRRGALAMFDKPVDVERLLARGTEVLRRQAHQRAAYA